MFARKIYIHEKDGWPNFAWRNDELLNSLTNVRHLQGKITGKLEALGFNLQNEANLNTITLDILKSSEIEGEILDSSQVRSSVARHLGMDIAGLVPSDRHVDGVVEMLLDATQNYDELLTDDRLFGWHSSLFPAGRSGMHKIIVGNWRDDSTEPMQVIFGAMGKEKVHFQAPKAENVANEMAKFLDWFNNDTALEPLLKAAVAHFWFITIHPFEDGNGRIARAITDMCLAKSDKSKMRFYSMSAQIREERAEYYNTLEMSQKGSLDVTNWLFWFIDCLEKALLATEVTLAKVLFKANFWEKVRPILINVRQQKMLNLILDNFEGKLTAQKWAKICKCSADTALRDIQDLINKEVLKKDAAGGRSAGYELFVN